MIRARWLGTKSSIRRRPKAGSGRAAWPASSPPNVGSLDRRGWSRGSPPHLLRYSRAEPCGIPSEAREFARDFAALRAALPDAHQPDHVETIGGDALQLGLRHVSQGNKSPGLAAQFLEPGPGVDFVDDG